MGNLTFKAFNSEKPPSLDEIKRGEKLKATEISSLGLIPNVTYAMLSAHTYKQAPSTSALIPKGWRVLVDSSSYNLDREGYYAVAYVNDTAKHCVIAQRGTAEVLGLRAGVWVYFDEITIQFCLAEEFSRQVRNNLRNHMDGSDWVVSYTGHSLGAVIAASRAVQEETYAVVFESPGTRAFLEKVLKNDSGNIETSVVTFLSPPNPINTLKPHCGYLIMIPQLASALPTSLLITATSNGGAASSSDSDGAVNNADSTAESDGNAAPSSNTTSSGGNSGGNGAALKSSTSTTSGPSAPAASYRNMFSAARFKIPSIRPQEYLRGYMLRGVGMGVPELQQYVSKVEPVIREMIENTYQVHSIETIIAYFSKGEEQKGEKLILRWPSHLMQFVEYYNTLRALEDPDNQTMFVNTAYKNMLERLCHTVDRPQDRIPITYINRKCVKFVEMWHTLQPEERQSFPLSLTQHKVLNTISIKDDCLYSEVLTALQAKQYLSIVLQRAEQHNTPLTEMKRSKL